MALCRNKSYVNAPSTKSFIGLTMHELLEERVETHPDREMHVFVSDNERITFAEFKRKVVDLAVGFLDLGFCKGDCVAIMGDNHMEWPLITGAARAIGVATVSLQVGHTPKTLSGIIQKTSAKALFITRSPETLYRSACNMIPELNISTPCDLTSKNFPSLKIVIASGSNQQSGTIKLDDLFITGGEEKVREAARKVISDDISYMIMTSGTTGIPKLVYFTHFRALNSIVSIECLVDANKVSRFACLTNIAYTGGTAISQVYPLLVGVTAVYPSPSYSFEKFLQAVQNESVTHFLMPIDRLTELAYSPITARYDLSSLRGGIASGSPIPKAILLHLRKKFKIDIMNLYGSTEIYDISGVLVEDGLETCTTVGRPLRNVEIQIVDHIGLPVKVGDEGEIWVRNQVPFKGYYRDVEKTNAAITKGGWFRTGDVGKLNADGYLTLDGRIKNIIIRRGLNIHPFHLETLLMNHPAVKNVQVVGIPDIRIGEDVCVCLILTIGHAFTEDDMKMYCTDKCFIHAQPTYCLVFESFPLGITGKVDRKKLREMAIGRITIPDAPYSNSKI